MALFDESLRRDFPDRAFRDLLSDWRNLRELMTRLMPDIEPTLDFSRAQRLEPEFLLADWRKRISDLMFLIPRRGDGEPVLVCLLLEHQSRPDPLMPLRMLLYAVLFWEQQWKEHERGHPLGAGLRLTPVLPVVFHTGGAAWDSNRTLAELFDGPEQMRAWAPQWPITYWDLSSVTAAELLASGLPFLQALAVARSEAGAPEEFRESYRASMLGLEASEQQDMVRKKDLQKFDFGVAAHRRPPAEVDDHYEILRNLRLEESERRELEAMTQQIKESWMQKNQREAKEKAEVETRDAWRDRMEFLQKEEDRIQQEKDRVQQEKDRVQQEKDRVQQEKDRVQQEKDRVQQEKDRVQQEKDRTQEGQDRLIRKMRSSLVAMLTARFGALPPGQAEAIDACGDLDRLTDGLVRAAGIGALSEFSL